MGKLFSCCNDDDTVDTSYQLKQRNPPGAGPSKPGVAAPVPSNQTTIQLNKEIAHKNRQIATKDKEIATKNQIITIRDQEICSLKTSCKQLKEKQQRLNSDIKTLQGELGRAKHQLHSLASKQAQEQAENKRLLAQITTKANQIATLQRRLEDARNENSQLRQTIIQLQNQLAGKIEELKQASQQLRQSVEDNRLKDEQLRLAAFDRDRLRNELQKAEQELRKSQDNLAHLQQQNKEIKKQLQQQRPNPKDMMQESSVNLREYFVGDVLDGEDDYKEFLLQILEKRLRCKIAKTRLLYKYDPLNKTNWHRYIDNRDNLVLVVKLANGNAVAAWSEGPFYPRMTSDKDGLIISLTNRRAFEPLKANIKAITYDEFYLIFGNAELRVKTSDKKVFSNFGVNNGFYDSKGQTVDLLLGSGKEREVEFENLEVFQLQLR